MLALIGALLALPGSAHAQERSTTADVVALTVCVIDADIRWAALAHRARGDDRDAATKAIAATMPDAVYRAQAERLVGEVYRVQAESPRGYVAARLEQCASGAARRVNAKAADGCYQLTRYASDFFAARAAGIPLERTVATLKDLAAEQGMPEGAEARLAKLAASVYATTVQAPEFRSGLFFHCIMPSPKAQ
ncbi:MAG: hypothetical protein ING59_13345 [Burkholderiales bacterium]|nr:hypothetical protein [Burkholderiales bacterium]